MNVERLAHGDGTAPSRISPSRLARRGLVARFCAYGSLTKPLQTALLLITGLAGHMSAYQNAASWPDLLALAGSLSLAISGSTMLNMAYDADIDAKMLRTAGRPLPAGRVRRREILVLGLALAGVGVVWALALAPLYGLVVLAGLLFDVLVYTIWLKRRTPWSILWGGIAGGMPILAGRVLAVGRVDAVGLLLALAVVLWIPVHILTLGLKRAAEYCMAGVPVLPNTHGERVTRWVLGLSTAGATMLMGYLAWQIGLTGGTLWAVLGLGALLVAFVLASTLRPSPRLDFILFKLASLYMLAAMGLIVIGA